MRPAAVGLGRASAGWRPYLQKGGIWSVVLALLAIGFLAVPEFSSTGNLQNLLRQSAALGIVAIGQTLVILTGGIDLSVGALMGLVVVITNGVMQGQAEAIPLAVLLGLGIGLAVGLFNGAMVVLTGINPLILTFGMLSILQGAVFVYTDRTIGRAPPEFQALAYGNMGPIPVPAIMLAIVAISAWILLRYTSFGRAVYAVGGNRDHARRAGVPTRAVTVGVYALSGFIAAVAGLMLAARLGTGYTLAGAGFEIDSIVAVVLGGTALTGGRGGVVGTMGGLFVLVLINNVLNLLAVSAYVQQVIKGVIVVAAVTVAGLAARRRSGG
jgi:ribose/xylose/arabinose/galactoside ABC-type transport system permease subunit